MTTITVAEGQCFQTQLKRSTDAHAPVTLTAMDAVLLLRRLA
ncbi:hypothetical protein [Synechococcus sp. RS9916]|nr:hypothetical protein [Synechococcus sp. RS9916]EAU74600.1 hypothetical protein RS9916_33872 [Synechococcus sp. RS9916]